MGVAAILKCDYHETQERVAMPTRTVDLTEHYDSFIDTSIAEGHFSNASEAVGAGLRLLELQRAEDRARIEWLRGAAQEGIDALDRGDYTSLRSRDEIRDFVRSAGSTRR
jgi:antitoxin ParD1/3/4